MIEICRCYGLVYAMLLLMLSSRHYADDMMPSQAAARFSRADAAAADYMLDSCFAIDAA